MEYKLLTWPWSPGHQPSLSPSLLPPPSSSHPGLYPVFRPHCLPAHSLDAQSPLSWTFPTPPCHSFISSSVCLNQIKASAPVHGTPLVSLSSLMSPSFSCVTCVSPASLLLCVFLDRPEPIAAHRLQAQGPKGESAPKSACLGLRAGHLTSCDLPCQKDNGNNNLCSVGSSLGTNTATCVKGS